MLWCFIYYLTEANARLVKSILEPSKIVKLFLYQPVGLALKYYNQKWAFVNDVFHVEFKVFNKVFKLIFSVTWKSIKANKVIDLFQL